MIDRTNINTTPSVSSINKINCDQVTNTELQNYFLGIFLCGKSLTATPAANIPVFDFTTTIPHFKRNVRAEAVYMNDSDPSAIIKIKADDQAETSIQMNTLNTRMQVDCQVSASVVEKDMDQLYRGSFLYNKYSSSSIRVAFDSTCQNTNTLSQMRVSGIQININPCHPSCKTCNGPLATNCLTCATSAGATGPVGGVCTCTSSSNSFQYGNCVATCDSSQFLFKTTTNLCIYAPNCKTFSADKCTQCQTGYYLIQEQCLSSCPVGYTASGSNCVSQNINIYDGKTYLSGLWRKDFSMIEISSLGITMSNYLKYNENSSVYSRCKDTNIYGGFFINQYNSVIKFPTLTNNKSYIKVTFKYYIIDYNVSGATSIFVKATVGSNVVQKEITSSTTGKTNVCGLSKIDIIDTFSQNFVLPSASNFQITIVNSNTSQKQTTDADTPNDHPYFGIREIEIFGFNCQFDFCKQCNISNCEVCIDGYFLNASKKCEICSTICNTCSSLTVCLTCKANFTLNSTTKICDCNDGFYLNTTNNTCIACTGTSCKTCNSSTPSQCTSCFTGKVLTQTGVCQDKCPGQQYADANSKCQLCLNNTCLTCNSSNSQLCLSCATPNFLTADKCQSTCPDKYYGDTTLRKCIACKNTNCKTCNPPTDNKCLSCSSPKLMKNGDCVDQCGDAYYKDPGSETCLACTSACKTCSPSNPSTCLTCNSPLVNDSGVCKVECSKGKFLDVASNTCLNCQNTTCFRCDISNTSICISCDTTQFLENSLCVTNCSPGYYKSITEKKCKPCTDSANCLICDSTTPTLCTKCKTPTALLGTVCTMNCGVYKYNNQSTQICTDCPASSNCLSCNPTQPTSCLTCEAPRGLLGVACVLNCGQGKFIDQNQLCSTCSNTSCLTCSSSDSNKCLSCPLDKVFYQNNCLLVCPDNYYKYPTSQICIKCLDSNCKTCDPSNQINCYNCISPFVKKQGSCLNSCGDKFYESNQECYPCLNQNCLTCDPNDSNICLTCPTNTSLFQGNCLAPCSDNYYLDPISGNCEQCTDINCKTCDSNNPNVCLSCIFPFLKKQGLCVGFCGDQYYESSRECYPCLNQKCTTCDPSNSNKCLTCTLPLEFSKNDCIIFCISTQVYHPILNQCILCDSECLTCDYQDITKCYSCDPPLVLLNNKCANSCLDGMYLDNSKNECINCNNSKCKTCNPTSSIECITCLSPKVLFNKDCTDQCDPNMYIDNNNECQYCTNPISACKSCLSTTPSKCENCDSSFMLLGDDCVTDCGDKYVKNPNTNICEQCLDPKCKQCSFSNKSQCISCSPPLVYLQNTFSCEDACPDNMYIDNLNSCQNCLNLNCKTCNSNNSDECIECFSNEYLKDQNCVTDCGKGYYLNTTTNECVECLNTNCFICSHLDSNICLKCEAPTALKNGNCVNDCGIGQVININNQECIFCQNQNCLTCDFPNTLKCLSCDASKILSSDDCISICPFNSYYDENIKLCIPCSNVNCEQCDQTLINCLTCKTPLVKQGMDCVQNCDQNMFIHPLLNSCEFCTNNMQNCLTCDPQNSSICTSCYSPYMLLNQNCVDQCGDNQVMNPQTRECENCSNSTCLTCSFDNKQECLSCQTGLVLNQSKDCVYSCGDSMYEENQVCFDCLDKNCQQCEPNSINCLSCTLPKSLLLNKCVTDCGDGYFSVNNICIPCNNASCKVCDPSNSIQCLSCSHPLVLLDQLCVDQCDDSQYEKSQVCYDCLDKNCKKCQPNSTDCTACFPPNSLLINDCVTDCGDGYLSVNNICVACKNSSCKSCNHNNTQECLSCSPPKILLDQNCVDQCGDQYYPDEQTNTCLSCPQKCQICYDKILCIECMDDSYNLNGYCLSQCPKKKFYENKILKECEQCIDPNCQECSESAASCSKCAVGFIKLLPSQKCQKCITPDCQNEEDKKDHHPPYTNKTAQNIIIGTLIGVSSIISILSPFYMMVSFFDLLQVTNYLVFINVNYSSTLYSFLQLFSFANFEIIPNIKNENSQAPAKFKQEEFDTVIFSNLIQSLALWLISFGLYLVSLSAKNLKSGKIQRFLRNYRQNYCYNIIIGLGFLTYCDIILSVFLQLQNTENIDAYNIAGVACSIIFIFLLILLNFMAYSASTTTFSYIKYKRLINYFYEGIYKNKAFMNLIYLCRKTLIIYTLVFKQEYPIYQSLQIILIIGLETTLMMILNPYRNQKELALNIFGRLMIIISLTLITFMSLDDSIDNIDSEIRLFFEIMIICHLVSLYISQLYYIIRQYVSHK